MKLQNGSDGIYLLYENYEAMKKESLHGTIYTLKPLYECRLEIHIPLINIQFSWFTTSGRSNGLEPDWNGEVKIRPNINIPVISFYSQKGKNSCTVAISDCLNPINISYGVSEEDKEIIIKIKRKSQDSFSVLLSTSGEEITDVIFSASSWVSSFYPKPVIPNESESIVYSTWYSMHQNVSQESVEEEAKVAKKIGFESVFLDDGWQTSDNRRGYKYTGDWEFDRSKFPDPVGHVKRIHQLNLNYVVWIALPFIGKESKIFNKFSKKLLRVNEGWGTGIVNPLDQETTDYIKERVNYLVKLGFDGLKVDFIDSIIDPNGRDDVYRKIPEFLEETLGPANGKLIEFRQRYISPIMLQYCNMIRSADCPGDHIENRIRSLSTRLISGIVPVHSDPLMWNSEDSMENISFAFINVLFTVPQISVMLKEQKSENLEVLRKWIEFWKEHRLTLLHGKISVKHMELNFPTVSSIINNQKITVCYSPIPVNVDGKEEIIINSSDSNLLLESETEAVYTVKDCNFQEVGKGRLSTGLNRISTPFCGQIYIETSKI